jgi:hypothetical protein
MEMNIPLLWNVLFYVVHIFHLEDVSTGSFERLINTYQTTRRRIPEEIHVHCHRRENLTSRKMINVCCCKLSEHLFVWRKQGRLCQEGRVSGHISLHLKPV